MAFGGKFMQKLLDVDMFGRGFRFKLPGNKLTNGTITGALFSIMMIITLSFYSITMTEQLIRFGGTVVTQSVRDSHFEPTTLFPTEIEDLHHGNFNIAFGLTAYDGNPKPIDDP